MADWDLPTLTSLYADFLTYLKARDYDSISLGHGTITNPQEGMIRYVRADDKFQEYLSAVWTDKVLSLAGGGTGGSTASAARTNLGLGTIATQAASGVAITGGSITGLSTLTTNGAVTIGAGIIAGSGAIGIVDSTGKIPAISSTYFASVSGANLTNLNGSNVSSGTVNFARLGSGGGGSTKFLREDNTWQSAGMRTVQLVEATLNLTSLSGNITLGTTLTDYTKAWISMSMTQGGDTSPHHISFKVTSNTNIAWNAENESGAATAYLVRMYVIESF